MEWLTGGPETPPPKKTLTPTLPLFLGTFHQPLIAVSSFLRNQPMCTGTPNAPQNVVFLRQIASHPGLTQSDFLSSSRYKPLCKQVKLRNPRLPCVTTCAFLSVCAWRRRQRRNRRSSAPPSPVLYLPSSLPLIPHFPPSFAFHLSGCRVGGCVGAGAGATRSGLGESVEGVESVREGRKKGSKTLCPCDVI